MAKLLKIVRDAKFIRYRVSRKGYQAEEDACITCKEAPLASFDKALQALGPIAAKILETDPDTWTKGLRVIEVDFSYTKAGTGSCAIHVAKLLNVTGDEHAMHTPFVRFEKAAKGEEGRMEVHTSEATKIAKLIEEAEAYIAGKRQQMLLPLEDPKKPTEPAEGESLPGMSK